jgi:hypothetical protein
MPTNFSLASPTLYICSAGPSPTCHQTSEIDVDISFGLFPFEREAVAHAITHEVGGILVPLPTAEDLLVMKAIAHRPRDIVDIESILAAQPKL